jgi:hypothetical protein
MVTIPIEQRVKSYVMIEATSYLEAYKYVLARLQSIGNDIDHGKGMPFQRYVVDCQPDLHPPDYLDRNTAIMIPTPDGKEKAIIPLSERSWSTVTPDVLKLDDAQFNALKHTLLSEMALIQGPPGTGKTFIGLKIMDILLRNKNIWKGLNEQGHIMVICYTNHALDQFLEDVLLKLQHKKPSLVRIGGRCKTESLANYTLRELCYQQRRSLPQSYWDSFKAIKNDLRRIADKVQQKKKLVSMEPQNVPVKLLNQYMTHNQFRSLNKVTYCLHVDDAKIRWLAGWDGLGDHTWYQRINLFNQGVLNPVVEEDYEDVNAHDLDSDSDSLITVAGEAELIQSERIVDDGYQKTSDLYQEYITRSNEDNRKWEGVRQQKLRRNGRGFQIKKMNAESPVQPDTDQLIDAYCETNLKSASPMDPAKAARRSDLWSLPQEDRFNLFLHWCDSLFKATDVALAEDLMEQEELNKKLRAIQLDRDCYIIGKQVVIGMTTTGAAKYADIVQRVRPQIVIVEEAAEVLEAHIVTALTENCKHLILIGDHKQLRPNPTVYELARDYSLNISLFERMIKNNMEVKSLSRQHRMRPEISQFLVPWIDKKLSDHYVVKTYPNIRGIQNNVVFLDHDRPESRSAESRSHSNDFEADFVARLCRYFLQQEYQPSQITILTTYSGQMFNIRNRMPKAVFEGVRITPVDSFQGEENDIIILSFVRSNNQRNIGFLKEPNRVCVAMSRAKMGFYAFGNFSMYASKTDTWKGMVGDMRKEGIFAHRSVTLRTRSM